MSVLLSAIEVSSISSEFAPSVTAMKYDDGYASHFPTMQLCSGAWNAIIDTVGPILQPDALAHLQLSQKLHVVTGTTGWLC
jgi:hypothetical protein